MEADEPDGEQTPVKESVPPFGGEVPPTSDAPPVEVKEEAVPPTPDEFARRVAAMAEEAAEHYLVWARKQADDIVAAAREQAEAELAQARRTAESIVADANSTAQGIVREASETRERADQTLAEATASAETRVREAEAEAERLHKRAIEAALQAGNAMLEAKRAVAADLIRSVREEAEADARRIRDQVRSHAEAEAFRLREEALLFSQQTRQRVIEMGAALVNHFRAAALGLEQDLAGSDVEGGGDNGTYGDVATPSPDWSPLVAANGADATAEPEPESEAPGVEPDAEPITSAIAAPAISKVLLIASPVRGFEQLFALEGKIAGLRQVAGAEVIDIDGLTARVNVSVTDLASFADGLGGLSLVRSLVREGPSLIRLTLSEQLEA